MKKLKVLLFIPLFFALAACNSGVQEQPADEEKTTDRNGMEESENVLDVEESADMKSEDEQTKTKEIEAEVNQTVSEPLYELTDSWSIVPIKEETDENVILLTIDDAPEHYSLEMANTLKELDVPAIFFVNGHFLESGAKKEELKQIHEMGFEIGNHTYNHQRLTEVDEATQKEEILSLSNLIEEITGEKPEFFRAPNGANTEYATALVEEEGMLLMNWTYGYDYFEPYMDTEKLKTAMITGEGPEVDVPYSLLKPGAILLMHDRQWTAEALADIVNGLREKGYEFADPEAIKLPE
ncbi:Peptidoglycan/xylan/chitin deacetylase, PgdA/CDA1 family [Gracilibacillus ureilyticus]|uniref:Peptidoglycan/xylan/chitin deacetylase, PgdA/CDA1 family n=1 Tax=Gracilibacillus ureilyticus TaxID=531814 RepID=A0A1H9TK01_9BACI|nr:polysaccharide deacetylase family protein [Gracilibacillus ureilyticus]SER97461.1 Peptidoglycan/xylan/chitin deacetylase, PgdA/CDA1 family [Gracilibacillus ureilyticus]